MANIKMYILGCKPLAVEPRNILKIENVKPFLFAILGSGLSESIVKAYLELYKDIKAYTELDQDIKGVIK